MDKALNDDLVHLATLDETSVLTELKIRYQNGKIYTYIGDILIAINPMRNLNIYNKEISELYKKCNDNLRAKFAPHLFATAEQTYREMILTQKSQCILISGESGSGKTETCKYVVQYLLNRSKQFEHCLNAKIQQVNPLLELFGNAKTQINHNSSRFGKFLEIYFEENGTIVGAKFKEYLLEKSRIVYQNQNESTFHIFYLLIFGLTKQDKEQLKINTNELRYRFIMNKNIFLSDNDIIDDYRGKYNLMKKNMENIGFSSEDINNLIKILISILFIGDITFINKNGSEDSVQIVNKQILTEICKLLELDYDELHDSFISDVQVTRGEKIRRERNMTQACDIRDALAKALYGRLFSWIVNQINHHIQPAEGVVPSYSIGLLDIFGFENFEINSFEQMCINLANEQLHQLFTKYIFKLEIQECFEEGIQLNDDDLASFKDNQIVLDMFLEKRNSIFVLLDEESRFPKANDHSLAIKLHNTLTPLYSELYTPPKNSGASFKVLHYAGQVNYTIDGFLDKNRDFLPNNLFVCARNSNNSLVQELFACKLTRRGTIAPSDRQSKLRKSLYPITNNVGNKKQSASVYSNRYQPNISQDKAFPLTVACHFKNSLHELIEKISSCNAFFIRCIKPNSEQKPLFNDLFVTKQLRYCSIMHVCKIRKCGYPYRIKFEDFLTWFNALSNCVLKYKSKLTLEDKCINCLQYVNIKNYKIGKTKVFLRYWHLDILNEQENKFKKKIILIQKVIRGWIVRNRLSKYYQQQSILFLNKLEKKSDNLFEKISSTSQKIQVKKLKKSKKEKKTHDSRFDLNEINLTIKEFDDMLFKYENENLLLPINEIPINRNKPFSKSIYNQSKDNTLKQRNALVAFEFKNLLHSNTEDKMQNNRSDDKICPHVRFLSPSNGKNETVTNNSNSQITAPLLNLNNMNTSQKENNLVNPRNSGVILTQAHFNDKLETTKKHSPDSTMKIETEYLQKIEDSKKSMPEWKLKLLKQKETKRPTSTIQKNEETPELMKHNIFLKKGRTTNSNQ